MILTGSKVECELREGGVRITPYDPTQLNPASYDLRLGEHVAVYRRTVFGASDPGVDGHLLGLDPDAYALNVDSPNETHAWVMTPEFGWVLKPGILYLMHTAERVWAERCAVIIDGKSSLGRLGVSVHQTAGYGDPGFDGQYTLEVTVPHPVRVFPGMRFCQARFVALDGHVRAYQGRYQGDHGPQASRVYEQLEEDAIRKGG